MKHFRLLLALAFVFSCSQVNTDCPVGDGCRYARCFSLPEDGSVVVISPYDGQRDTFRFETPAGRIICMSSSDVACVDALGADSVLCALSGKRYLSNVKLRQSSLPDVGYDAFIDYESILLAAPDVIVTYQIGASRPPYLEKLLSLGIPVMILYEHLEQHPLARAEYVRLFGALTGKRAEADAFFDGVCHRYDSLLAISPVSGAGKRKSVLMNAPYGDNWYIPGGDNYMSRLVSDAGGTILGAEPGRNESRSVSLEQAYRLASEADIWLCPGMSTTRDQLLESNRLFPAMWGKDDARPIYNNVKRLNGTGGNDFWETGSIRPDLILEDLLEISGPSCNADSLHYFIPLL